MFILEKIKDLEKTYKKIRLIIALILLISFVLFSLLLILIKDKFLAVTILTIELSLFFIVDYAIYIYIYKELRVRYRYLNNSHNLYSILEKVNLENEKELKLFNISIYQYKIQDKTYESLVKLDLSSKYNLKVSNKYILEYEVNYEESY